MLIKIKLPRRAVHSLAFDIFRRRQDAFLPIDLSQAGVTGLGKE